MTDLPDDLGSCWVLVWSARQKTFHHETLDEMLRRNWISFAGQHNSESDWILLALAKTHQEVVDIGRQFAETKERGQRAQNQPEGKP